MDSHPSPLIWEQLVTEAHVRAARLRRIQPLLVGIAIAMMIIGVFILQRIKPPEVENDRLKTLTTYVERQQWRVLEAFSGLPRPRISPSEVARLIDGPATFTLHQEILTELNRAGDLPANPKLREVEPSAFWRSPWPKDRLVWTGSGDVRVVGGLVNAGDAEFPAPARVIIVYRRHGDDWTAVTVDAPGFISFVETPPVPIQTLPITLKPVLKLKERQ